MGAVCSCSVKHPDDPSGAYSGEREPLIADKERIAVKTLIRLLERRTVVDFYEGEAYQSLLTLAYSKKPSLQLSAATALSEITDQDIRISSKRAIEPLLYLLETGTDPVQEASSAALGNISAATENKILIVQRNALPLLIQRLGSETSVGTQANIAGCITNLASAEENKGAILAGGALGPLVSLAHGSEDLRVLRNVAGAILNLTHTDEARTHVVSAGAVPVLAELLLSGDKDVQYYAATALGNLAVNADAVSSHDVVTPLVGLLANATPEVRTQAALTLRNLASDPEFQVAVVRYGAVEHLRDMLRSPYIPLFLAASACLRNLSIHADNEIPIADADVVPDLVALLRISVCPEAQSHAVAVLQNLAAGFSADYIAPRMVEAAVVPTLCAVLESPENNTLVRVEAARAIGALAQNSVLRDELSAVNVMAALVSICNSAGADGELRAAAFSAIRAMTNTRSSDGEQEFVRVWEEPDGGLQTTLAASLAAGAGKGDCDDDGRGLVASGVATWIVVALVEAGYAKIRELVVDHPLVAGYLDVLSKLASNASSPGSTSSGALDSEDASTVVEPCRDDGMAAASSRVGYMAMHALSLIRS